MARHLNFETGLLLLALLLAGFGGMAAAGVAMGTAAAIAAALALMVGLPLAAALQDKLIEVYARRGKLDRALQLAWAIRDAAPNARMRNRALVDVALLQLLRRDYAGALKSLGQVKLALVNGEGARAVVVGHIAYCMAHLGEDLPRAEEHARDAMKNAPEEPIFSYFLGLVLLQRGSAAEAEELIAASLQKNPDPAEPFPGERAWALARARAAQGKDVEPARSQAIAAGGHFAEEARALAASAAG